MARKMAAKPRVPKGSTPVTDTVTAQIDRVVRLFPDNTARLLQDTRKRIAAAGRAAEKRAAQISREMRTQSEQIWQDVEKLARRQLEMLEGRLSVSSRQLTKQFATWRRQLREPLRLAANRLEQRARRFLSQRLDLATHTELRRACERLDALEKRLSRLERRERSGTGAKPVAAPPAAA